MKNLMRDVKQMLWTMGVLSVLASVLVLLAKSPLLRVSDAVAQQIVTTTAGPFTTAGGGPCSGTLLTTGDQVVCPAQGGSWASVKISFGLSASPANQTVSYSIDGGTNYLPSGSGAPYLKRVDAVTANPSVIAFAATSVTGVTAAYEFPLAGNVTHVKVAATSTGVNAQTVTISGFMPYVPGVPVTAVLWDVTSAVNTVNDAGKLDMSGWSQLFWQTSVPTGGAGRIYTIDDTGTAAFTPITFNVGSFVGGMGAGTTLGGVSSGATITASLPLPKRVQPNIDATATLTSRLRLEVRR